jgi:hypothetical protein
MLYDRDTSLCAASTVNIVPVYVSFKHCTVGCESLSSNPCKEKHHFLRYCLSRWSEVESLELPPLSSFVVLRAEFVQVK